MSVLIAVRSLAYPTNTKRYLYHSSRFLVDGKELSRLVLMGTLVVRVTVSWRPGRSVVIFKQSVWGSEVGVFGAFLPDLSALGNIFGEPLANPVATCSIDLAYRLTFGQGDLTFSGTTVLGSAP